MRITSQHREEEDLSIGIMQIGHMSFPFGSAVLECDYFPLEIGVRLTNDLAIKIKAGCVNEVYRICLNPLYFVTFDNSLFKTGYRSRVRKRTIIQ